MTNINFTLVNSNDLSSEVAFEAPVETLMALLRPYQSLVQDHHLQSITLRWYFDFHPSEDYDFYAPRIELNSLLEVRVFARCLRTDASFNSPWVEMDKYFPALPYQIYSSWHVSDVQTQAPNLTDDEASQVLARLKTRHDSNIGINWDSIDATIDLLFQDIRDCTRLDRMPHVTLEGYYKDEPNHIYKDGYALIGTYPENPTSAEESQDGTVMYYFESAEELKVGFEIGDFVITSWEIFDATVPTT